MRTLFVISALLAALTLAACGGGSNAKPTPTLFQRPTATPIDPTQEALATAWEKLARITPPPTPTPLVAGPDMRPCTASDVVAALASRSGASMHGFFDIGLGNRSSTACQLRTIPELRGRDGDGNAVTLDFSVEAPCPAANPIGGFCMFPFPVLLLPGLGEITEQHRLKSGQAVFVLSLLSPAACPSPPPLVVPDVRLLLPDGGGEVDVRDLSFSACDGHVEIVKFAPTTAPN